MMLSFCMLPFSSYLPGFTHALMREGNYIFDHRLQKRATQGIGAKVSADLPAQGTCTYVQFTG